MATNLADNIFNYIFLNENDRIPIQIALKFVPKTPIDNMPALVQVMTWHRQVPSHYLNQWFPVDWRIYASQGGDELSNLWNILYLR